MAARSLGDGSAASAEIAPAPSNVSPEAALSLLQQLQQWCKRAEESGIAALEEFAVVVRAYSLQSR